jgi:ribosomal protein S18 acetylase RimI-like enzyme
MKLTFKQMNTQQELTESANVIRESFATVAEQLGLTQDNAPTNPAFIETRHLQNMRKKGIKMLGVFYAQVQIGFVAIEKKPGNSFYMERLAVLPNYRHKGFGRRIVEYVADYIAGQGGEAVLIGVINEHEVLKAWYRTLGFVDLRTERFAHLPFVVCYMEKNCSIF